MLTQVVILGVLSAVALPNLLAGRQLVPEFLQQAVTPGALADAVADILQRAVEPDCPAAATNDAFAKLHLQLRNECGTCVADALLRLSECAGD